MSIRNLRGNYNLKIVGEYFGKPRITLNSIGVTKRVLLTFQVHQIQFWVGFRPRPHFGSSQRSPDCQAVTSEGNTQKEGNGFKREAKGEKACRVGDN